jgi:ABC-type transport system involved in cytochrome c biogenesis permease subunit
MGMLAAVLNSNFWLTTHIVSVALGYAGCSAAGVAGHIYIIQRLFARSFEVKSSSTAHSVYGILAFGLMFTTIGTILGGMWADHSWGRFWGWDPKENGALLIVLWCAVLFHARAARIIADMGMAFGAIVGQMLVMFAWIGVNLLGIGMHSYGFTSAGAQLLWGFLGFEGVFLAVAAIAFVMRRRRGRVQVS